MFKYFLLPLFCLLLLFASATAQTTDDAEDPFENDPFFTQPIQEVLSPARFRENLRKQRDRVLLHGGIDTRYRDISGYSNFPGLSTLMPNLQNIRFNRVDGLALGFRVEPLNWSEYREVRPFGFANYSFARKRINYGIGLERVFGHRKRFKLGVEYHNTTDSDDQWRLGSTENSLFSLFSGFDYMDYYNRRGVSAYMVFRHSAWFDHTLSFRIDEHHSLDTNTKFNMFGGRSNVRVNPEINEGRYQYFLYSLNYNTKNYMQFRNLSFAGDITVQLGDFDNFATDYRHNRYEAELRSLIKIDRLSAVKARFRAGSATGAEIPSNFALGGVGSLRAHPYKSIMGERMLLTNVELLMGNWQARDRWGNDWISSKRVYYSLFADFGWVNSNRVTGNNPISGFGSFRFADVKTDLGVSVNFSVVRFELAWQAADILGTPVFWVRLNQVF
ncbi:MAG: DUF5686 family protein [Cyclonatronaceae bacterium]